MAKAKKEPTTTEISIIDIQTTTIDVYLLGVSPLVCNAMSLKTRSELLFPSGRKTASDKINLMKHDPIQEFRDSVYRDISVDGATRINFFAAAFKKAMASAAIDLPGVTKTQIGRLVWAQGTYVPIWGVPQLKMSVVRSADMAKTPDIHSHAALPHWATKVTFSFVRPILSQQVLAQLLGIAGLLIGVGDGRQEKGHFSFGQFKLVNNDDPDYLAVVNAGGRAQQDVAFRNPAPFDSETENLFAEFEKRALSKERKITRRQIDNGDDATISAA